jgi:hypothetical protein
MPVKLSHIVSRRYAHGRLNARGFRDPAFSSSHECTGSFMLATYIDVIIMFCVGLWTTGVGYGYLPVPGKANAVPQKQWFARFGTLFKWCGPLLLVISVALAGATLMGLTK